ncbi:MAG TPA: PH domain-containing protein [Candidatus Paceibacterota bacterium]
MNSDQAPILTFDAYQTLGKKTFWLFLSKWLETPVSFLVLAFIFSFIRRLSVVPPQYQRLIAIGSIVCLGISIICFVVSVLSARFVFKNQGFNIGPDALKIRKGIFTRQEIAIPYRQIQNVDIERTLFQQATGVSKLVIVTAGADDPSTARVESQGILETVDREIAEALQSELLRRADVQRVVTMHR